MSDSPPREVAPRFVPEWRNPGVELVVGRHHEQVGRRLVTLDAGQPVLDHAAARIRSGEFEKAAATVFCSLPEMG